MALYELSDNLAAAARNLVNNAQIRGADAPVIIQLQQALSRPVDNPRKPKDDPPNRPGDKPKT